MDTDPHRDGEILELSSEYAALRFTLRQIRSGIDEAEERRGRRASDDPYLASLRERYVDGKRRVSEIRIALGTLEPVTLDGMKAKALALESERMERAPSLRRALAAAHGERR
jgi:hypothetical protein